MTSNHIQLALDPIVWDASDEVTPSRAEKVPFWKLDADDWKDALHLVQHAKSDQDTLDAIESMPHLDLHHADSSQDGYDQTLLYHALFRGLAKTAKYLFSKGVALPIKSSISTTDQEHVLFHHVCYHGYLECAQLMMENGQDVNESYAPFQMTALMYACMSSVSSIALIDRLLERGARVNDRDGQGKSALVFAILNSRNPESVDIIRACLHAKADTTIAWINDDKQPFANHHVRDFIFYANLENTLTTVCDLIRDKPELIHLIDSNET